jgi:uncharacterized protein YjiS (DUF1127 family)
MIPALEGVRLLKAPPIITIRGGLSRPERVSPITRTNAACRQRIFPILPMRLSATIRSWIERSRQRQALRKLAERNDYLLKDIGVSQAEALREAAKPFWES